MWGVDKELLLVFVRKMQAEVGGLHENMFTSKVQRYHIRALQQQQQKQTKKNTTKQTNKKNKIKTLLEPEMLTKLLFT